ncbi:cytochrome P450 [Lipomyces kononenkoae]|uniref:Cytochrome P450 n=1 Tax=Lipomyces kononenkoae TaxID=34357 RepID=A0ACC3SVG6_LIPKO
MFSLEFLVSVVAILVSGIILQHLLLSATSDEPPFIRGPIPFLGAALSFARDPRPLLHRLQKKYGWIFTVYVAGQRITILSDPIFGNRQVWNNSTSVSLPMFTRYISETLFKFTKSMTNDFEFQEQLTKKVISILNSKPLLADIVQTLKVTYLSEVDDSSQYANCDGDVIDLYEYCRHNVYYSSARALFGPGFPFDEIYLPYIRFEDDITKFVKGYPRFLNREGYNARQKVLDELGSFFMDPSRVAQSSVLVRSLYEMFTTSTHNTPADLSGFFFAIIFASKSNSVPAAFWMLANIGADAELKAEVESIIARHYDPNSEDFDWAALVENPLLVSCFKETVRLNANVISGRHVTQDLDIKVAHQSEQHTKEYRLRKGSSIMMSVNMLHWNEEVYPDPMKWMGKRFLEENKGNLVRHSDKWRTAYAPWGGGAHMCPGRFLAIYEAVIQLVYTLARFDVEPIEDLPGPVIGDRYGGGVFKADRGYRVKFTRRKSPLKSVA